MRFSLSHIDHGRPCAGRGLRARTSALQRTGTDRAGVYPDHHQRLEPPCYHDAYRGGQLSTEGPPRAPATMNDEGLADGEAANPFRFIRTSPAGLGVLALGTANTGRLAALVFLS